MALGSCSCSNSCGSPLMMKQSASWRTVLYMSCLFPHWLSQARTLLWHCSVVQTISAASQ